MKKWIGQVSGLLGWLMMSLSPVFAQSDNIDEYFAGLETFEAKFTQKLFNADQQLQEESYGLIKVKRPDQFRLEYNKPYLQVYVADGKQLWSYDADLEQVIVKPQQGILHNTPAMILSNPKSLNADYLITRQEGENDDLSWFELAPRNQESQFDSIQLAFDKDQIRIMELKDGFGQITRLEFQQMKKNPAFAASVFKFTPPKGVDVIKQ